MAAAPQNKQWKRSWKNLLLNKRYQLRFTLFMVAVSAVLVTVLGWWVMKKANEATAVAMTAVQGEACPKIPALTDTGEDNAVPMKLDDSPAPDEAKQTPPPEEAKPAPPPPPPPPAPSVSDTKAAAELWCSHPASCKPAPAEPLVIKAPKCDEYVQKKLKDPAYRDALRKADITIIRCEGGQTVSVSEGDTDAEPERHVQVQIDETSMTLTPVVPNDYADRVVKHWACEMRQAGDIESLDHNRMRVLWVLIGTGIILMLGLAFYGIKMTHRVAGPLFKVSLYLAKMRDGRFDKVYNLRKGDQLVDFYEHFKTAHAGVVKLEKDDIDQLKAVIAAAEGAGLGDQDSVAELKKVLERKEKSVE